MTKNKCVIRRGEIDSLVKNFLLPSPENVFVFYFQERGWGEVK